MSRASVADKLAALGGVGALGALVWILFPRPAATRYAEERRTPKPGCEQRRRVHEYNQKQREAQAQREAYGPLRRGSRCE